MNPEEPQEPIGPVAGMEPSDAPPPSPEAILEEALRELKQEAVREASHRLGRPLTREEARLVTEDDDPEPAHDEPTAPHPAR